MKHRRWLLALAAAVAMLQVGFLVLMIAGRAAVLRDGAEIVLEVKPVDPRDLLRGDYVVLDYNISRIDTGLLVSPPTDEQKRGGRTIFVRVKPDSQGIWQAVAARYDQKPEPIAAADETDIRGMVGPWYGNASSVGVDYGVERFYLPEGEGREIERSMNVRPFRIKLAVDANGTAQIKSFHDGETMLYEEPLY